MASKNSNFFFWILLFLLLDDEVNFSAGFPARPVGSLGATYPIRLAAHPTRSSYSVFLHHRWFFGSDLGYLPAGFPAISWLMGVLGHPTQSPQCRFLWGFMVTNPSPVESQRFLVKILHFDHFFFFCFFFLVMRLIFRLAFRLDQLAVWVDPIPSTWLLVLLGHPTLSSHITSYFGSDLGYLPAGFPAISWLMGLLGHPTQSPQCRFLWGFMVTDPSPVESQRFLVKILHFDLSQHDKGWLCMSALFACPLLLWTTIFPITIGCSSALKKHKKTMASKNSSYFFFMADINAFLILAKSRTSILIILLVHEIHSVLQVDLSTLCLDSRPIFQCLKILAILLKVVFFLRLQSS